MLVATNFGHKRKIHTQYYQIKLYQSINDKCYLLYLKPGYVIHPSAPEIYTNKFIIKDLRIRYNNTEVFWKGLIDLRYLKAPLYQLIDLGPTHIEVYPDEKQKAVAGKQLNKTCFVTFCQQYRINKKKLIKICQQYKCQLLQVNEQKKYFTVQIPHFTKYSFNTQEKDKEEENSQDQQQQKDSNFANVLKQKHLKALQKQKLKKQSQLGLQGLNISPQMTAKSYHVVQSIQKQVKQHNLDKGHYIDDERIKGSSITYGINGNVDCTLSSQNKHYIGFNAIQIKSRQNLNIVFQILKDHSKINFYIFSPDVSFKVKRVLVLYMICFEISKCLFDFQKKENKLRLVKIQNPPQNYYFLKYLKNWFQWVLNEDLSLVEISKNYSQDEKQKQKQKQKQKLLKNLALRRTQQQAQQELKFKNLNDAEFLSSIQDQHYRCEEPSRNLKLQLRQIASGNMQIFQNYPWIVKLAVFLWYYNFKPLQSTLGQQILDQSVGNCTSYNLQRHILRTFGDKSFSKENLTNVSQKQLPLWWLISNINTKKQKEISENKKLPKVYEEYRFNLLMQLTQMFEDSGVTLQFISRQKYLNKEHLKRIFVKFINKYPKQIQKTSDNIWNEQQLSLIHESKAQRHYSNNKYLKALSQFAECKTFSKDSQVILNQIVSKQEIICGFHRKTILKIRSILERIKSQAIKNQLMFLNVTLGLQQLRKNKVQNLISLCYRIPQLKVRLRMLDQLFNAIIKSPNIIIQLKKDPEFQNYLITYYTDPRYQLELKFAKLQF